MTDLDAPGQELIAGSPEIRQQLDAVAYTDELLRFILAEAIRVGVVAPMDGALAGGPVERRGGAPRPTGGRAASATPQRQNLDREVDCG